MTNRTYSELRRLTTMEERFEYLSLRGKVGDATFGFDRYLNQMFYTSIQWKQVRDYVIVRDKSNDLGVSGFPIHGRLHIHHMNPMTTEAIVTDDPKILDPEFLICVALRTHNAVHYGDKTQLPQPYVERRPGDTKLW